MRAELRVLMPGDCSVTVHEMTVAEVRAWINDSARSTFRDPVQALAFESIGLDELARMTDFDAADLEQFTPGELAPVLQAARELNPHFFRFRSALEDASALASARAIPPATSTAPSAYSSASTDTPTS